MPRRGENIYKRKDGRWEGRYIKTRTEAGKSIYGYVYARTYHDVRMKLHEAADANRSMISTQSTESELFASIAVEWFDSIIPQIKISTENKYWNLLHSYILPTYGNLSLDSITHEFIEKNSHELLVHGGKNGTGLSPKTVSDILSVIRNILRYAGKKGIYIPCDGSDVHIKSDHGEMRILSRSEQTKLCCYLTSNLTPYNAGILICLFTGLRIGEVCALRWEDVSFEDQTLHVHGTLQRIQDRSGNGQKTKIIVTTPKSLCSIRTIPIPDIILQILTVHRTSFSGYLLTNSESHYVEPRTLQNHFQKALRCCNIAPANFHALRHTFATRCIELGFDVKSLSEILGHATVNITMNRYVHPTLELKKENMERLSFLFAVN